MGTQDMGDHPAFLKGVPMGAKAKLRFLCWASGLQFMKRGEHWAVLTDVASGRFELAKVGLDAGQNASGDASMRYQSRARRSGDFKSCAAGEVSAMRGDDERV
jgi:hypothetical protein